MAYDRRLELVSQVKDEKTRLKRLLDESFQSIMAAAGRLAPDAVVTADGKWRVQDIVGHLEAWDEAIITSLLAYRDGREYRIQDSGFASGDDFNEHSFQKRARLAVQSIYAQWAAARTRLAAAIDETAADKFEGTMRCPWGGQGTITTMVQDTVGHDKEHLDELVKLAEQSGKTT
jgi:Mycothiol maleylpyruvate isomerase N-terminal domain